MIWPRVIGQQRVKETLLAALRTNRLAHAYLFHGNDGVGKDAVAIELARVIHCERGGDEACGGCLSCTRLDTMQHPDVRLVTALPRGKEEVNSDPPLGKLLPEEVRTVQEQYRLKGRNPYHHINIPRASIIKINSIREVRREAAMSTGGNKRRVFIISRADELNDAASNTILKTLEEPAGNTMLILTTARLDALLPTIRSRCQLIRFDPLAEEEIAAALVERNNTPADEARLVARLCSGSFARAQELLLEDLAQERQEALEFIRHALGSNSVAIADDIDRITTGQDREPQRRFLNLLLLWFRDALVLKHGREIINVDQAADLRRFVDRFARANVHQVIADIDRAVSLLDRNVYIKLVFLQLVVQLRSNILHSSVLHPADG